MPTPPDLGGQPTVPPALPPTEVLGVTPLGRPRPALPTVPGYEIVRELGRGGMGVVYEAKQLSLGRPVALKMVLGGAFADPSDTARFLAEAKTVAAVRHPNVVHVYEFAEHAGRPYFAMEYVAGGTLHHLLHRRGPLPPHEAARIVEQIARGVQAAHDLGIVHRDLKPGNVLIDTSGRPLVTDFGLAKGGGATVTKTGDVMGTPAYMAPEQARALNKTVGPATDVYALGVILYECLTGRVPFPGDDPIGVLLQVVEDPPPELRRLAPHVPRDLERICLKCLAKKQSARYPSAAALADDLGLVLDPAVIPRVPRRFPVAVAAVAAVGVLSAGVGGWLLTQALLPRTSPPATPAAATPPGTVSESLASDQFVWGTPVGLGDGVNTPDGERMPTLSRDELTLVFHRGQDKLYVSRRASRGEPFPPAEPLPAEINDLKPMSPSLSGDGLELAFHSQAADRHVWLSTRPSADRPFGPPARGPEAAFPTQWEQGPCLSDDGLTLLFTALPRQRGVGTGSADVVLARRATRAELFPPADLVPGAVNTPDFETASWLSPDGRVLLSVVQSKAGEACRYHTRKGADEPFGPPVPFDPFAGKVLVGKPWLSPDGRRVYFHARAAGRSDLDLWVSELRAK